MTYYPSTYPLSVPQDLYDDVCDACTQPFADSYLYGAEIRGRNLWPRTLTGWEKMRQSRDFMDVLEVTTLKLEKPTPFTPNCGRASAADLGFQPKPKGRGQ